MNNYREYSIFAKVEAEIIAKICCYHGGGENISGLEEYRKIGSYRIRSRFLAALIRLFDELDSDYRRAPEILFTQSHLNEESRKHWKTCQMIHALICEDNSIDIDIKTTKKDYYLIKDKLNKIQSELTLLNPYLENCNYDKIICSINCDGEKYKQTIKNGEIVTESKGYAKAFTLKPAANQYSSLSSEPSSIIEKSAIESVSLDISAEILMSEYQRELEYAKKLLEENRIDVALNYLEDLKAEIWDNATDMVKYGILKYMGSANHKLLQNEKAGQLFIESYEHNPDDEESIFVKALGHLLLDQIVEAREWAKKALDKNETNSKAYSIIAETFKDKSLDYIISKIPDKCRNTKDVSYTLGIISRVKGDLTEAEKWLRIALEKNEENFPDLKGNLGEVLLMSLSEDPYFIYTDKISDSKKGKLKEIETLLEESWNNISDIQMKKSRISWIANLTTTKLLLNDLKSAEKYIESGLKIDSSDPYLWKNKALLLLNKGKSNEAKVILSELGNSDPQAPLILAFELKTEENYLGSINTLKSFLRDNPNDNRQKMAKDLLLDLYILTENLDNAEKIYNSLYDSNTNDIAGMIYAAHISKLKGNEENYIHILNEAKNHINDLTTPQQLSMLADKFYNLEKLEDAASIYEKFVDIETNSNLTKRIIDCYYRSGEIGKALKICQSLREKYGVLRYVSEIEIAIYYEIDDLNKVKILIKDYLNSYPSNLEMKIGQAILNLHLNDFNAVDEFLNSSINLNELSLEQFEKLAHLYHFREFDNNKYVDILYEMRRKYYNEYSAHAEYVKSLLYKNINFESTPIIVDFDTAICLKNHFGIKEWFILEKRDDIISELKEINSNNLISKNTLGKFIGDITFIGKGVSLTDVTIVDIKRKYIHALHESMEILKDSTDDYGIHSIDLDLDEKKKFEPIFDMLREQNKRRIETEKIFKEKLITVGALAEIRGSNVVETWVNIVNNPNLDLKCYSESNGEQNNILLLNEDIKLVIDLVSLLTIHEIKVADNIAKTFGKIGISRTTLDEIIRALHEQKNLKEREFFYTGVSNDEIVMQDSHPEIIQKNIKYLADLLDWIKNNCEIIPCSAALKINRTERAKYNYMLGKSFMDTILIASEKGNLLYSDDGPLRILAKQNYNVNGIWTQAVLIECLKRGDLKIEDYNKAINKLTRFSYHSTYYNVGVFLAAAEESGWVPLNPYTRFVDVILQENKDLNLPYIFIEFNRSEIVLKEKKKTNKRLNLMKILCVFISELSKQSISKEQQESLISYLISRIACRSDGYLILSEISFVVSSLIIDKYNSLKKPLNLNSLKNI